MQLIVNGTDALEHLIAARHVIEELIANRQHTAPAPIPQQKTETLGPPLSNPAEMNPPPVQERHIMQAPTPAPAPEKPKKPKVVKAISADEVRAVMVEKAKAGKDAEIRSLLKTGFGVDRLSQVAIADLPALKDMVEAL